jgi:hypothetical protein
MSELPEEEGSPRSAASESPPVSPRTEKSESDVEDDEPDPELASKVS